MNESRRAALLRALLVHLAAPLENSKKMLLTDLCNRLTTRALVDRSITGLAACAAGDRWILPRPRDPPKRDALIRVLPSGAEPPCGNSAPAGHAFDDASPASVVSLTWPRLAFLPTGDLGHHLPRWHPPGPALSAELRVGERPLTLPVAPRALRKPGWLSRNQNRCHRPHVNVSGLSRPRAPFLDRCSQERRFRSCSPVCGSPPPISRLCHRRFGFRRSFTLPSALAWEG
jgi:hypothetical protein